MRLCDAVSGGIKKSMPVLSFPGIQFLNVTVNQLISSSDLQAECMEVIAQKYPTLASVSLMDLSVEAECFGSNIQFSDDEVPTVVGNIVNTADDVEKLKIPEIGSGRTQVCIDAMSKAVKRITDRPVLAGVIGPFSLAGRLLDMTEIMVSCMDNPEMTHILLKKTSQFITGYAQALKSAGANGLVIAEPAAGLLSPVFNEEFSVPYIKSLVDSVQDDDFSVVYHNCGPYTVQQINDILQIGAKVYHFGNAINLDDIKNHIPEDVLFSGNVAPADCFRNGTPEIMRKATLKILESCGHLKNFIPSSGCDIPPVSSLDNINAFFDVIESFYNK